VSFIETRLNDGLIIFGTAGGPQFNTTVVEVGSGDEHRNANWDQSRGRWELGERVVTQAELAAITAFFRAVKGRTHGFRWKDFADYKATNTAAPDGSIGYLGGDGVGTGTPAYQLVKRYVTGALVDLRDIKKPVAGTVKVYRGGVEIPAGAGDGEWSIDTTTGVVTFVRYGQSPVSALTVGATTQVTLSPAIAGLLTGEKLYLAGLGGTVGNGTQQPRAHD
jgi:uncharacterized protein (TIGR02217 family)